MNLFMRIQTQWKVGGVGQRIGLDYSGVEIVASRTGFDLTNDLFGQIQLMELSALKEFRKNG